MLVEGHHIIIIIIPLLLIKRKYKCSRHNYKCNRYGILALLAGTYLSSGKTNYKMLEKHKNWELIQFPNVS